MKKYRLTFKSEKGGTMATETTTKDFSKNGWISPNGDFYGFEGAYHLTAAHYIFAGVLNKKESELKELNKNVQFFKILHDNVLRDNGWAEIKDISWITKSMSDVKSTTGIYSKKLLTQKQKDVLFDYSEFFKLDYKELIGNSK